MANQIVELEGRGPVTLTPTNHLATGGEASVYRIGDLIVKVYLDKAKMARDGMAEKVKLLAPLKSETIVAPEGVARDKKTGEPVGFFMGFVQGEPLPRVFTSAFWQRTPFTGENANTLVEAMRETVKSAHGAGAVMVDANDLNWLVSLGKKPVPKVIDVDSWAIGKWQAQVIMPSIRDWHRHGFDALSDWFSWACVTFQIYTGTHPYRGTLDGYKSSEWEKRMKDNASVFAPGVRLPAAVRDFSVIPDPLRAWYEAVFQKGERSIPPSPYDKAITAQPAAVVQRVASTTTGALVFEKLFDAHLVRKVWPCGAGLIEIGGVDVVFDVASKKQLAQVPKGAQVEVVRVDGGWVIGALSTKFEKPTFWFADGSMKAAFPLDLLGHALFRFENRLFLASGTNLIELEYMRTNKPILSVKQTFSVLHPQATEWFDGVGVERAFTATFVMTPFSRASCATTRVPELDGLKILDGKAGTRFAAFVGEDKNGALKKIELTFDADYSKYVAWVGDTDSHELNMACLPKGVVATVVRDGELAIFVPTTGKTVKVQDRMITTGISLGNFENTVVFLDRGAVWSVKMR